MKNVEKKKRCVIFDMDGCLVDTERAYINAWIQAFETEGIPVEKETVERWSGRGATQINAVVSEISGSEERMLALRKLREAYFRDALLAGKVELMPGTREILDFVKTSGSKLGVASSTFTQKAQTVLEYFDIYKLFDFHVFGDMIEHLKPAPDIYNRALALAEIPKEECITFEDSSFGVQAAHNAGIDVVYVPDIGMRAPDGMASYEVASFHEGIDILKKLLD